MLSQRHFIYSFLVKASRTKLSAKVSKPTSSLPRSSLGHLRTYSANRLPNLSGSSGAVLSRRFTSSIALPEGVSLFLLAARVAAGHCDASACGTSSFNSFGAPSEWNEPMSSRIHVKLRRSMSKENCLHPINKGIRAWLKVSVSVQYLLCNVEQKHL